MDARELTKGELLFTTENATGDGIPGKNEMKALKTQKWSWML